MLESHPWLRQRFAFEAHAWLGDGYREDASDADEGDGEAFSEVHGERIWLPVGD